MSKILFIDDEPDMNRRVRKAIEALGYDVNSCTEATKGLELMTTRVDWSIVILDMMMPVPEKWQAEVTDGITGLKVLAQARNWLVHHNIPVLIFSNRRTDLLKDRLDAMGFPPHLLARVEKDALMPKDIAQRVFELAGAAARKSNFEGPDVLHK